MNPTALKFLEALRLQKRKSTQDHNSISSDNIKLTIYPSLDAEEIESIKLDFKSLKLCSENAIYPTLLIADVAGIKINFVSIYEEFKKNSNYLGQVGDWNLKISGQNDLYCLEVS
jgi:hypothetical protein